MKIELRDIGKRYRREWVLRHIDYELQSGHSYAVVGPNGSGKSTLLRLLSGHLSPSRGDRQYSDAQGDPIAVSELYRYLTYAAPYIELVEEFTLQEAIRFHARFKSWQPGLNEAELPALWQLEGARHKPIAHFSSGMKQRLKIGLAICSHTPLLLLDEPTTTLDQAGVTWYRDLVARFGADRLLVIASNVDQDIDFCEARIDIQQYK